eukprot:5477004-Amphidinium_carterae.1
MSRLYTGRSWRRLKHKCLRFARKEMGSADLQFRRQLEFMHQQGFWFDSATFVCLAAFLMPPRAVSRLLPGASSCTWVRYAWGPGSARHARNGALLG